MGRAGLMSLLQQQVEQRGIEVLSSTPAVALITRAER